MLTMSRIYLLLLFAASCHSRGDIDRCEGREVPQTVESGCCGIQLGNDDFQTSGDAANNQFPWLASIESSSGDMYFTGVLISSRHVLTTAQVDIFYYDQVRLGVYKKNQTDNDAGVTIPISSMRSHAIDVHHGLANDIAVILLADNAPYNEFIRPICLPSSDIQDSTAHQYRFMNAGWSRRTSNENVVVKHYVTLPHVKRRTCLQAYSYNPIVVLDNEICAGGCDISYQTITCKENGGGPLMVKQNGRYTIFGITTFGSYRCGVQGVPDVFTTIYPYLSWIRTSATDLLEEFLNPFGIY